MSEPKLTFICGYAGSGKTTYGKTLAESMGMEFIEASDIVKSIMNSEKRSDISNKAGLDVEIIDRLRAVTTPTVVSGVRQVSILKAFRGSPIVWLSVPFLIREERVTKRKSVKDNIPLVEADSLDNQLGVGEILRYIQQNHL